MNFFRKKARPPAAPVAAAHGDGDSMALAAARSKSAALRSAVAASTYFSSIATDEDGVIQYFDAGAERMLGYQAFEVIGRKTPADLCDPEEEAQRASRLSEELKTHIGPGFGTLVFKASRGLEDVHELTYIRKDGGRVRAIVAVVALRDDQRGVIGYLLNGTDDTQRLTAEGQQVSTVLALQATIAGLEHARTLAERANQAKSDYLSSMSHELRAPLNAILGFAQLMGSDSPPPTANQQASIGQILDAGWYLLELITEILDLAAIESGNLTMSVEPVALDDVMRECEAILRPQATRRGIALSFQRATAPTFVRADHTRVKQVVLSLVTNAIKFNQPGGMVAVECQPRDELRVRISVRDTGPGLSPEAQQRLFRTPTREEAGRGVGQGAGFGLVMSKRLVELMGGAIGVDSTVGVGSVFWFELPPGTAPKLVAWPTLTGDAVPQAPDGIPRTVLYIEDNPANLALVQQLVARRPELKLLTAVNAALGVALARAAQPDVVLMDINLPGVDGVKALGLLRDDPITSDIPVVAVSANAMPGDVARGLAAGFDLYLTKPIVAMEFMAAIDSMIVLGVARSGR